MMNYPAPGQFVDGRDHYMHINRAGSGSPTVVMDFGLGATSLDRVRIQPQVASYTRACADIAPVMAGAVAALIRAPALLS